MDNPVALGSLLVAAAACIGAVIAAFKLQPERNQIMVTTAEGLVVMQSKVLEQVSQQLHACEEDRHLCEIDRKELREAIERFERIAREHGWEV